MKDAAPLAQHAQSFGAGARQEIERVHDNMLSLRVSGHFLPSATHCNSWNLEPLLHWYIVRALVRKLKRQRTLIWSIGRLLGAMIIKSSER